ncbi:MAG TPA: hypothetical protein VEH56_06545 [Candidatus Saccharimonadales bacterium]|nr:hypothetical protein [Candidatus Saccharimonadales bacterium]
MSAPPKKIVLKPGRLRNTSLWFTMLSILVIQDITNSLSGVEYRKEFKPFVLLEISHDDEF